MAQMAKDADLDMQKAFPDRGHATPVPLHLHPFLMEKSPKHRAPCTVAVIGIDPLGRNGK